MFIVGLLVTVILAPVAAGICDVVSTIQLRNVLPFLLLLKLLLFLLLLLLLLLLSFLPTYALLLGEGRSQFPWKRFLRAIWNSSILLWPLGLPAFLLPCCCHPWSYCRPCRCLCPCPWPGRPGSRLLASRPPGGPGNSWQDRSLQGQALVRYLCLPMVIFSLSAGSASCPSLSSFWLPYSVCLAISSMRGEPGPG